MYITAHFYNIIDLKDPVAGIGAKTWVRQAIRKGTDPEKIVSYCRDHYPNTKESSIRRYITDYKEQSAANSQSVSSDIDRSSDISGDTSGNDDQSANQSLQTDTSDAQVLDIGDLPPAELKPEGQNIQKMYSDQKLPQATIHLERLPKMIKKSINLLTKWGPLKEKFAKWNDQEAIEAVASDAQTVIQNRLRISSKNADVIDLTLSIGNLGLSMFLTAVDPNHKPTKQDKELDDRIKKELKEKHPDIVDQLDTIEKDLKNPQIVVQNDQTTKPVSS